MMGKGEVDVYFVITIATAIIGFIIVLYFLIGLDFGQYSEEEICELSVLTRATTPASAQGYVPLKCTTGKICLTNGKDCDNFAGYKDINNIELPGNADDAARKIEEISAKAMYDCWNKKGGQGKLDLFGTFWRELGLDENSDKSTCVICSRVAISDDVGREVLEKVDVNNYMEKNNVPGKALTYLQVFTNQGTNAFVRVTEQNKAELESKLEQRSDSGNELKNLESKNNREMAFVFMQIKTKGYDEALDNIEKTGIAVAGGAFMMPVIGKYLINPIVIGGALIFGAGVAYEAYENVKQSQIAAAGYCGEFESSEEKAVNGCSLVQAIPYDKNYINKLCGVVQGNQ